MFTTTTDTKGRYSFSGLDAGSYTLRASYGSYQGQAVGRTVNGRSSLKGIVILINPAVRAAGVASLEPESDEEPGAPSGEDGRPTIRIETDDFGGAWVFVEGELEGRNWVLETSNDLRHWEPLEAGTDGGTAIEIPGGRRATQRPGSSASARNPSHRTGTQ